MVEVVLKGLSKNAEEGTIATWFFEEGDTLEEGDDLVELTSEEGTVTIQSPCAGVLAEVYYDEGEAVAKDEILCTIDEAGDDEEDEEEEEEEEAKEDDAKETEDDDEEEDEEDEEE